MVSSQKHCIYVHFLQNCGGYNEQNLDNCRCGGLNLVLVAQFLFSSVVYSLP